MKRFTDNYQPVEIELVDKDGKSVALKSRFMNQKDWLANQSLVSDDKATSNCYQMANIFGGQPEDYVNFSSDILKDAIEYYLTQLGKNPQKAQGN